MTPDEFDTFLQLLDAAFTGELVPDGPEEAALRRYFERVPADLATATVDRLVLDGQTFIPKPGELMAALRRVVPDQTFGLRAALAGQTVAEYVVSREPRRVGPAARPAFDVLEGARVELEAGS